MRATALLVVVFGTLLLEGCQSCTKVAPDEEEGPIGTDTPPDPHDIGSWLSMKVTADNRPAVAYYDRTSDALGFAIGTIGADGAVAWATEEVDSYPDENGLNPGDAGKYASMAIAADGTVWVAYQDTSNGSLKYAKRDKAGVWTDGLADAGSGPTPDAGYWASLALDSTGAPVVAHYDHAQGALRVARWNGTAFTGAVAYAGTDYTPTDTAVEAADGDAGEYVRLVIAEDGTEYIAFYDRAWGALRLASGNASGYGVEIVDHALDGAADVGQWPDMLVSGANVTIAYHDVTNQDLKLAQGRPGSAWTLETLDAGDHVGADTALYANGSDPAVLYFDGANNDMKLVRKTGDAWAAETVVGAGLATGYHNETVTIDGLRYVACYDYTATNRTIWFSALP